MSTPRPPSQPQHTVPAAAGNEPSSLGGDTIGQPNSEEAPASPYEFLSPPQQPDEVGRLGGFRVLKQLGAGGMGMVFAAEDLTLHRPVALKVMLGQVAANATSRERFIREARAAAAVKHDNIVTVYGVGEGRNTPFIAMEFLQGVPLDEWLKKHGRATIQQTLRIGREVCEGLAAAHSKGLIHRDIKPANVWLEAPKGRVKLLDFGLARAQDDAQLTREGAAVGTPAFMSPEQARGEKVDFRTDLFSVGVMLYRMLTGEQPFKGTTMMAVLMSLGVDTPPPVKTLVPEVPAVLSDLVERLMSKDASGRPTSAAEVGKQLRAIERELAKGNAPAASGPMPVIVTVPQPTEVNNPWNDIDASASVVEPANTLASGGRQSPEATPNVTAMSDARGVHTPRSPRRKLYLAAAALASLVVVAGVILSLTGPSGKPTEPDASPGSMAKGNAAKPTTPGTTGYALEFDGNAFVTLPESIPSRGRAQLLTIEAWVKPTQISSVEPRIFLARSYRGGLFIEPKEKLWGATFYTRQSIVSSEPVVLGRPVRLALTYDGQTVRLFVDGKLAASTDAARIALTYPAFLGTDFFGLIDDVRISDNCRYTADYTPGRPEKDADTLALYHFDEGTGDILTDSSGNGHHGKITGAKWVPAAGTASLPPADGANHALEFDGKSLVVLAGLFDLAPGKPYSIEVLAKPTAFPSAARAFPIRSDQANAMKTGIAIVKGSNQWFATEVSGVSSKIPAELNRATRLALTSDGKNKSFFVDGKLVATLSSRSASNSLDLGSDFIGTLDDVRISSICRYNADYTPARPEKDADTIALYHFDEGTGDVLTDSSGNGHHGKITGAKWVKRPDDPPTTLPQPAPVAGPLKGLEFDGVNSRVEIPDLFVSPIEITTVETWIDFKAPSKKNGGFNVFNSRSESTDAINLSYWGQQFDVVSGRGGMLRVDRSHAVSPGRIHVAAVYAPLDQSNVIYINGKKANKDGLVRDVRGQSNLLGSAIGRAGSLAEPFAGRMYGLRVSKGAKYTADFTPPTEFKAEPDSIAVYRFDEGQGDELKDSSGNGHHGKITGAKWVKAEATASEVRHALQFTDGQTVSVPTLQINRTEPTTVEAYVTFRPQATNAEVVGFPSFAMLGRYKFSLGGFLSSKGAFHYHFGKAPIPNHRRVHLAGVRHGANVRLYIDGVLSDSTDAAPNANGVAKEFFIGGVGFDGIIDEVRVSKSLLYETDFTPPARLQADASTLALYRFTEGQGDELKDSSGNGHHGKITGAKWVKADGAAGAPPATGP